MSTGLHKSIQEYVQYCVYNKIFPLGLDSSPNHMSFLLIILSVNLIFICLYDLPFSTGAHSPSIKSPEVVDTLLPPSVVIVCGCFIFLDDGK